MIKSFTATTREIDDAQAAVAEIITALDLEKNLLKNSLGIIACFSEFEETGVLKAICNALPFDCVGATTCLCACGQEVDQIIFAITVLTSDDCAFHTTAIPIVENYEASVDRAIAALIERSEKKPALLVSYFPFMTTVSGDMILATIDRATGGIPLFGTMAIDHTVDYPTAKTIRNGEAFRETAVLGAIFGTPKLSFAVASLDASKIRKQKAVITGSDGNILTGINGKTALAYLEEIGLAKNDIATGLGVFPLVVDHMDGTTPVARAVFALTPEGHAVCGGAMPVNATIAIGSLGTDDILYTTEKILKPFVEKDSVVLSYSCIARYFVLGANSSAEAEKMREMAAGAKYLFACSGGEICPLPDGNGKLKNFFHNFTNVFCKLS